MKFAWAFGSCLVAIIAAAGCDLVGSQSVVAGEGTEVSNAASKTPAASEAAAQVASPTKQSPGAPSQSLAERIQVSNSYNSLTPEEERVLVHKGTERAYTGEYTALKAAGTFICRRCNAPLYKSDTKFDSHCGWPSFDDNLANAVERRPDADGYRVEIVCNNCGGHLGHVFEGEGFTTKNTRHCVNSISVKFIPEGKDMPKVLHGKKL